MIQFHHDVDKHVFAPLLLDLDLYYPGISTWLETLSVGAQTPVITAHQNGSPIGIVIGKRSPTETKLRCVRVHRDHRNTGLGIRLVDRMLEHMESRYPLCTVSEELMHGYSRAFINRYGFSLTQVEKGIYRPRKLEYVFNRML